MSLQVTTTCTPVVGAGPEMQAAHSVQSSKQQLSQCICEGAQCMQHIFSMSTQCLPYGYQSSCSAMNTCNHAHTILDLSVSYIDATDS